MTDETRYNTDVCPLDIGVATRPRNMNELNGDATIIKYWDKSALVGVIDGVGHGHFAHHAAQTALKYIEDHFDQPLAEIFLGVGRVCRVTRGVVMALARFDWEVNRLTFASFGDINVHTYPDPKLFHFVMRRGIVGIRSPNPIVTEHIWPPVYMMALHSDGLAAQWSWDDFPDFGAKSATSIANELLDKLARDDDDATILVVKGKIL